MIDARADRRPSDRCRRIPQKSCSVQTIARTEIVWQRYRSEGRRHYGIKSSAGNVVWVVGCRTDVICANAISFGPDAIVYSRGKGTGAAINE